MRRIRPIYAALIVAGLLTLKVSAQATSQEPSGTVTTAPSLPITLPGSSRNELPSPAPLAVQVALDAGAGNSQSGAPPQSIMFAGRQSGATAGPRATSFKPVALDSTTTGDQYVSGRALIGATSYPPLEKLHVAGGNITVRAPSNGNGMISPFIGFGPAGSAYSRTNAYIAAQYANPWYTSSDLVFYTTSASDITTVNASEKLRISGSGNVGIGTTAPVSKLSVYSAGPTSIAMGNTAISAGQLGMVIGSLSGRADNQADQSASASFGGVKIITDDTNWYKGRLGFFTNNIDGTAPYLYAVEKEKMTISANGNVGIGATSPIGLLQIGSTFPARFEDAATGGILNGVVLDMTGSSEIHLGGLQIGNMAMPIIQTTGGAGVSPLQLNLSSDNDVVIGSSSSAHGLQVNSLPTATSSFSGNVTVIGTMTAGTVYAKYQDVAEWVPASESMPAGTVVVISDATNNTVTPSTSAYDTGVAGVVSPTPGLLLGMASDSKAKIATTGRVKVRVDASKYPIRKGDLLVTSDRPGMAMKSEPLDVGGTKIHRPGTLIGKALEPLAGGEGEILVLLSLQ